MILLTGDCMGKRSRNRDACFLHNDCVSADARVSYLRTRL